MECRQKPRIKHLASSPAGPDTHDTFVPKPTFGRNDGMGRSLQNGVPPVPMTPSPTDDGRPTQLIDLALQGGGSHGAFTWGVLDRLLEEPWLRIEAISGTSAGALNAAVLADGHANGGSEGARAALEAF